MVSFSFSNCILYFLVSLLLVTLISILLQKDPVFAVFSFILHILLISLFLLIVGAEFFALLVLIIYAGVIVVLFLFVVIIYQIRTIDISIRSFFLNPLIVILITKLYWLYGVLQNELMHQFRFVRLEKICTLDVSGFILLFNEHFTSFIFSGLLIFIAFIGSISLTQTDK
jgi:NADH-quinone oxidoreductase subunit J